MVSPNLMGQMSPSQAEIESSTKKPRGGNFTIEEDNILVSAWLNTSLDPVQGNEQTKNTYWKRIWGYFNQYKTFVSKRSQVSLINRWSIIQKSINKFCRYLVQIESIHQSRLNEQDKIAKAKIMFHEFQKTSFRFEHCWNVLKCQPKWINDREKWTKRPSAMTSSSTPDPINLGEDDISTNDFVELERPLDRKAKNERLSKRKIKDSACADVPGILNEIKEEMKKMNEKKMELIEKTSAQEQERLRILHEHEQDELRFKQEKFRVEQVREEDRIMLMNTSGLSEIQKEYIHHRQMEILENQRRK